MVIGKVAGWMRKLDKGQAVVIERDDVLDSAGAYRDSGFDHIRPEYVKKVVNEVSSEEYPEFSLSERPDGRFALDRR